MAVQGGPNWGPQEAEVEVQCWCGRGYVRVPLEDVGLYTRVCGREDCEEGMVPSR